MTVFSFCCQLWHIRAFSGFRMSPLSLQVKVNTQDPTHGAAVSALNETPLPGQPGTPGVNGRGGGQRQPPLLDVVLSGSPSLPGLSFSTTLYCSTASLSLSFLPSPLGPLFTPSKAFSNAKRTHTSKQQHAPYNVDTRPRRQTQRQTKTHEETRAQDAHTIRKSLKGFLILSALSSLYHPQPILLSDCTETIQKRRYNLD